MLFLVSRFRCVLRQHLVMCLDFFFFQAEDGIRDYKVTGVQTCALPISEVRSDLQPACRGIYAEAVLDGILDQWLKRQARYIDSEKVRWHVDVNFQTIIDRKSVV